MSKTLLLINPVQDARLNLSSVPGLRLTPTSLAYLAALTPPEWDITLVDENVTPLIPAEADLVGITAITTNALRAYEISELYRRNGTKTVMGGIHASMMPGEAIKFVDSVVIGEAESVWQTVLHDFECNELQRFYHGERISLENSIRPRRDLYSSHKYKANFIQTARGCPNDCEFCSVTIFGGRLYRQRPVEEVLNELEDVDGKNLFFIDDNILGYGSKAESRAIQLFRGMKARGLNKRWACQVGIDFAANPEVLRCAREAGCAVAFIGFESVNEETLRGMHKARNLKIGIGNYKDIAQRIHDHGIAIHGAFVFGGDGDKQDVFPRTIEFILDSNIDSAQLTIMTPLPGTRFFSRLEAEGRLLRTNYPYDWKYYDFAEAVFQPRHMTVDELEEGVAEVYRHTTSKTVSLKRAFNTLFQTKNVPATINAYLWNRGYGSLLERKYRHVKDTRVSGVEDWQLDTSLTGWESFGD
jgi:radical SAM superfamily enzyme YgiQ (UPF0313 family)